MEEQTETESVKIVNVYPIEEEILNSTASMICPHCHKTFQNSSACRLHAIKVHKVFDEKNGTDVRIFDRMSDEVNLQYHCPSEECRSKNIIFHTMRDLKQHFIRIHTEKKFACECGYKTALEKDIKYHKRVRCTRLKQPIVRNAPKKSKTKNAAKEAGNQTQPAHTVVQPIFLIVPAENVASVVENIQLSLASSTSSEIAIQTLQSNGIRVVTAQQQQDVPTTSSNGYQEVLMPSAYEYGHNLCNRGTGMDDMMSYYPSYPTEMTTDFGGGGDHQNQQQQPQQQPQTRSMGTATTMFDSVPTRTMGTSMNEDDDFMSIYLRDIETQTPAEQHQHQQQHQQDDPWNWRMMD